MSLVEPTLLSLARAAIVAGLALAVLLLGGPGVKAWSRPMRRLVFWAAAIALLMPGFAMAFFWYGTVTQTREALETAYCICAFARYFPLAVLALWLYPPAISAAALHVQMSVRRRSWLARLRCELHAWGQGLWIAVLLVFILTFQEFELATMWNLRAWTVALFDAQVGGLALAETLKLAVLPVLLQAALFALLACASRPEPPLAVDGPDLSDLSDRSGATAFGVGISVFWLLPVTPVAMALCFFAPDAPPIMAPWREIGNSLVAGISAALLAWMLSGRIMRQRGWRWLVLLPGLFGPLITGLLLLAALNLPLLRYLGDTPLPAIAGLALSLSPYALLLRIGSAAVSDPASLHVARDARAPKPQWLAVGWPRLCGVLMLFCFGFGDFTLNALLAPPGFTSAPARLLNLLHYGQSQMLSVMFVMSIVVPLGFALLTIVTARFYPRRRVR